MTPETGRHLDELRDLAEKASSVQMANVHLGEARGLLAIESSRAHGINQYWTGTQVAPYWRKYWNELFIANEQPVASPDPLLLSTEARMREAFDRGDFQRAADEAATLPPILGEAMSRTAGSLIKARQDKATFNARRTPCVPGAIPNRTSGKPKIQPTEELESFYPDGPRKAGVQGTAVLRVKVDSAGCGREVALVVRSGVPELDLAALSWFETARFAPAWRDGKAVPANLTFKMRFTMDEPDSRDLADLSWADSAAPKAPR
jgi:TonB family protein